MSEMDFQYSETGFFTEESKLVSLESKTKHPSNTEKDDANLLSEGSSDEDVEDELVLEYTDGTLQENVSYEEGLSVSPSDAEVSGLANGYQIYKDSIPVTKELESSDANNEGYITQDARVAESRKICDTTADVFLETDEIAKIADILSVSNLQSVELDVSENAVITTDKAVTKTSHLNSNDEFADKEFECVNEAKISGSNSILSDCIDVKNNKVANYMPSEISVNDDELEWEEEYPLTETTYKEPDHRQIRFASAVIALSSNSSTKIAANRDFTNENDKNDENNMEVIKENQNAEDVLKGKSVDNVFDPPKTQKPPNTNVKDFAKTDIPLKQAANTSRHKLKTKKKRVRHKIYLDDPDIHQRISHYSAALKKIVSQIGSERFISCSESKLHPVSRDDVFEVKMKRKGSKKRYTALSTLKMMDQQSVDDLESLRSSQSTDHLGPYDGHGKRGRNLIARIKEFSETSSSTDDDDEITNSKIKAAGLGNVNKGRPTRLCSECGEQHSFDDDSNAESDQEPCHDCGIPHNSFQHPLSASAKDPPEPAKEENLPSIEGPHTIEELNAGVRYKLKYLGTTQVLTQHPVTKETRMQQAQEAYFRIKVAEGEVQPCTQTEMIISLERLKVVNCEGKHDDVMMDHALRTVCFICDIGDIIVLMSRRLTTDLPDLTPDVGSQMSLANIVAEKEKRTSKNICHIFESDQAQLVSKVIGQAFNMAYQKFLRSNGISHDNVEEAEYCHVLESQKIVGQDLDLLTDKNSSRDVLIQKKRNEPLGLMLLESGWGSMLPTVFIAHIANYSPAARLGGQISVGDHVLACNGASFVGLPLSECNQLLRSTRASARVVLKLVACPPVVDVVVSRPDTKYQLGFSVQNGTICSLLRGGIAERGGVRVGHRIIEINGESVVAKSHQHIVDILAHTSGEISMKTLPVAMYRLMVGIDTPLHV